MRVLITQPAQDSEATATMLRGRGHTVLSGPLIIAERLPSPKINLSAAQGFVVTGGEGARALADHVGVRTFPVFTDSAATKDVLRGLGFQQILVAKDDTADLARLVERNLKPSAGALIHACSNGPATNLGALLGNMGFALRPLPLYSLKRATTLPPDISAALRGEALDAAVFLAPEEARAFVALVQQQKLEGIVRNLAAVAASPAVAAPLRALKFRGVTVPSGGTLEDIAAALDGALVDKVEEQRAAVEQRAREETLRERAAAEADAAKQAEAKRIADERAEQERVRRLAAEEESRKREQAAQAEAERKRAAEIAAQSARAQAAKEQAERERIAKEQERAAREARAEAERKAKEDERRRREQAAREDAAKQAEAKRIAEEQARAERDARREQQRMEDEARAAAKRDSDEKARLAHAQAAEEEVERKRAAEEQARMEREARREAEEKARLAREAKREQQRREDEARAAAKREVDEAARRAREQVAGEEAERKRLADEQARIEREAKRAQERLEEEAHAAARRAAEETARLAREQAAREETERRRIAEEQARVEREAKLEQQRLEDEVLRAARGEADEKARLAREQAAKEEAERRRIADEQARLERKARREQQRREDEARAKAKREAEEQERLARMERERQREAQAAQERAAREEAERRAAAAEAARLAADAERLARGQAAREELSRTVLERKRAQAAFAAQERAFSTQVQTDEAARAAAERERRESEQRAAEQARAATLARQEEQRRAEEQAHAEAERGRQRAEAAERQRQKDEAAAFAKAEALKAAKAEQERAAAARAAQDEAVRIAAAERRAQDAAREEAAAQKPAVPAPASPADRESAPIAPPGFGAGLTSWWAKTFAGASSSAPASPARPSWAMIRDGNSSEREPEPAGPPPVASMITPMVTEATLLRDVETPPPQVLAPAPASATMAPIPSPVAVDDGAVRADEPQTPQPENQPEVSSEPQPVSQPLSSDPPEPSDNPAPIRTAESARGGRAARLLAEDAADDKARGQRFKNYSFGDNTEAPAESERPAAPRRRSRAPLLFLFLVLLTVGAYLSSSWWMAKLTPMPRTPSAAQIAPAGELAALAARVRALEDKTAGAASAADFAAMRKSLAERALPSGATGEVKPGEINESLANQGRQVAALTARLSTLEAAIGNAARLDELNKRMSALEGKSADAASVLTLSERVNALEGAGRSAASAQAGAVAYVMALGQWQNALASGRPFALELETAKALALRGNTAINDAGFASYAAGGLPTFADLQARFDAVAAATVRAAAVPDDTAGWLRRVLDRIMSIATIRRVDGDVAGDSAWAIVARAESRLGRNDLSGAVTEMEKLQGEAARAAAAWVGPAQARIKAEHTLGEATIKAIAAVAAAGDVGRGATDKPAS